MEHIAAAAAEYDVKYVISAGDLLDDSEPDPHTVRKLRLWIDALYDQKIAFAYVEGNHDKQLCAWPKAVSGKAFHLHKEMVILEGGLSITGLDYQSEGLVQAVSALPDSDVFVCHQMWEELSRGGNSDGSIMLFPRDCTIFSGDIHVNFERNVKGYRKFISPGATHMRKIDEPLTYYFYLLTEKGTMIRKQLRSRPLHREIIENQAQLDQFIEEGWDVVKADWKANGELDDLPAVVSQPLLIVRYAASIEHVKSRLVKAVEADIHLIAKPIPEQDFARDTDEAPVKVMANLVDYLANRLPKTDKRYEKVAALLAAKDKQAAVAKLRESYGL